MKLKEEQTLKGHNGRVWGCSWSPTGNLLATCGEDANVRYDHCHDYETLLLLLLPYFFFSKRAGIAGTTFYNHLNIWTRITIDRLAHSCSIN